MLILFTFKSCCDFMHLYLCEYTHTHSCICAWQVASMCLSLCDPMDHSLQACLSIGFSRQKYWSGLPWPPSGDLPNPRIEPESLLSPALAGRFFATSAWEARRVSMCVCVYTCVFEIYIYIWEWEIQIYVEGVGHWFNRAIFVWYLDQFFSFLIKIISTE